MNELVDFHIHSSYSCDGDHSPAELVRAASEAGYRAISIADHDTVAAYPEALDAGRAAGLEIIPGIELTTVYEGREFHLLLPFVDWRGEPIGRIIREQTESRMREARERVEKVRAAGFELNWEEVLEKSNGAPPLGVKMAQILLENPVNRTNPALAGYYHGADSVQAPYHFYRDYFAAGKAACVPKKYIRLEDALAAAQATGGVPVAAHPGAYFEMATEADLRRLKSLGLFGLEVYTFYHTAEQTAMYAGLAEKLGLIPTVGSDYHGRIKPHVKLGALREGGYWMVEKLREEAERRGNGQ